LHFYAGYGICNTIIIGFCREQVFLRIAGAAVKGTLYYHHDSVSEVDKNSKTPVMLNNN
jgi:hypothetical protein